MISAQIDDRVREQLERVVEILRPHAQSSGSFVNPQDVRTAIDLAGVSLSRGARLVSKLTR